MFRCQHTSYTLAWKNEGFERFSWTPHAAHATKSGPCAVPLKATQAACELAARAYKMSRCATLYRAQQSGSVWGLSQRDTHDRIISPALSRLRSIADPCEARCCAQETSGKPEVQPHRGQEPHPTGAATSRGSVTLSPPDAPIHPLPSELMSRDTVEVVPLESESEGM